MSFDIKLPPIVQVTSSRSWGGREQIPLTIHGYLHRLGVATRLVCDAQSAIARHAHGDQTVVPTDCARQLSPGARQGIRRAIADIQAHAVLVHRTHDLSTVRWALRGKNDPLLIVVKHVGPGPPKRDLVHRYLYRRVDAILAVSNYIRDKCIRTYPIESRLCRTWYLGVDHEHIAPLEKTRSEHRRKLTIDDDRIVLVSVARLTPGKGWEMLLDTFHEVVKAYEQATLLAVGGNSPDEQRFADSLMQQCSLLGLENKIRWIGQVDDIRPYLWAGDVFISPSAREAFGLNTVEAMAAGCPVIGINSGGTAEIITSGSDGILVPPGTVQGLSTAALELIGHKGLREFLAREGQRTANRRFSLNAMMSRLGDHLAGLRQSRPAGQLPMPVNPV